MNYRVLGFTFMFVVDGIAIMLSIKGADGIIVSLLIVDALFFALYMKQVEYTKRLREQLYSMIDGIDEIRKELKKRIKKDEKKVKKLKKKKTVKK